MKYGPTVQLLKAPDSWPLAISVGPLIKRFFPHNILSLYVSICLYMCIYIIYIHTLYTLYVQYILYTYTARYSYWEMIAWALLAECAPWRRLESFGSAELRKSGTRLNSTVEIGSWAKPAAGQNHGCAWEDWERTMGPCLNLTWKVIYIYIYQNSIILGNKSA